MSSCRDYAGSAPASSPGSRPCSCKRLRSCADFVAEPLVLVEHRLDVAEQPATPRHQRGVDRRRPRDRRPHEGLRPAAPLRLPSAGREPHHDLVSHPSDLDGVEVGEDLGRRGRRSRAAGRAGDARCRCSCGPAGWPRSTPARASSCCGAEGRPVGHLSEPWPTRWSISRRTTSMSTPSSVSTTAPIPSLSRSTPSRRCSVPT